MRANRRFPGNSASVAPDPCALMSTTEDLLNSAGEQAVAVVDEDQAIWSSLGAVHVLNRRRWRERLANRRQNFAKAVSFPETRAHTVRTGWPRLAFLTSLHAKLAESLIPIIVLRSIADHFIV
jgi:hypothetical protein